MQNHYGLTKLLYLHHKCLSVLRLSHLFVLTTNRPSPGKHSLEILFFFFLPPHFWPASWKQTIKIQYLISHLISAALMDVSWSFGREPRLLPSGGPSWHQLQRGQGKVTSETRPNVQQPQPQTWCFKVETDIQMSTEEKQSSVELIHVAPNTLKSNATKPRPILDANTSPCSAMDCLLTTSHTNELTAYLEDLLP